MPKSYKKSKKKKKPRSKVLLFAKVFLITTFSSLTVMVAAAVVYYNTVSPPEIPVRQPIHVVDSSGTNSSSDNNENESAGPGLTAPERFTNDDRRDLFFTFLIIGLNEGTNANTIMVAAYDGVNHEANLISIPRDSLINVNRRNRKLSGAFMNGALGGRGVEGGVAQMQREVMSVVGFVPDFYIVVNYNAFTQIIDAVGGIDVYVPFHMRYDDPCQNLHIDIRPGQQTMNGATALHFARFRTNNPGFRGITDYDRIKNQQTVISAVIASVLRPQNIRRIPEFISIATDNVYTNLTVENMIWFASQHSEMDGTDSIHFHTAPTTGTSGSPMWYELLDADGIVDLVNKTVNPFAHSIRLSDLDIIRN